jgi:DNA-damage-inducible protein D
MDKQSMKKHKATFDEIAHFISNEDNSEQVEIWLARESQTVLGYALWRILLLLSDMR